MIPAEHIYEVIYIRHLSKYNTDAITYLPYGSSNFYNLQTIHGQGCPLASCIFNDQEPINIHEWRQLATLKVNDANLWVSSEIKRNTTNPMLPHVFSLSASGKTFIAHSEQYSDDIKFIEENCDVIPIYYWWHGLVARSWFNIYQFNPDITYTVNDGQQRFLLYCRAFTGTREYRLKLLEQIAKKGIAEHFKLNFHADDGDVNYKDITPVNYKFKCNVELENYFNEGEQWSATSSASINVDDFRSTRISIVAETVFENKVWHSEKICKAIAAGHPFILLAGAKSLKVLREYGFKTFSEFWDESYDLIEDNYLRLIAITKVLEKLAKLSQEEFDALCNNVKDIVNYNQQYFYSKEFEKVLMDEVDKNFTIITDVQPDALGGDIINLMQFAYHNNINTNEIIINLLATNVNYLKLNYPEVYKNVTLAYKDMLSHFNLLD
jgi:hypothetical protein